MEPTHEANDMRLIVCPRPLSVTRDRVDVPIPAGATVAEHLVGIGCELDRLTALVYLDDRLLPRAEWEWTKTKPGQALAVRAIPLDSGDGGKGILSIIATIGLIVATWYVGGGGLGAILPGVLGTAFSAGAPGAALLAGAVTIGGSLAISGLIPPSTPNERTHAGSELLAEATGEETCFHT